MRSRQLAAVVLAAAGLLTTGTSAQAALIESRGGPLSGTNGIVLGPDGNLWVAEEFNGSVVRIAPGGGVVSRFSVGNVNNARPTAVTNGPGGKVWVSVPGENKLTWFDATSPAPTAHDVPTPTDCGPIALVADGVGRMYFSLPSDGTCNGGLSQLGTVPDSGLAPATSFGGVGSNVYDLAVAGGRLFAPDFDEDKIRRLTLGASPTVDATYSVPGGSQPDGITADGAGVVWATAWGTGRLFRFPAGQAGGALPPITPTGGALVNPFGIVASRDGRIYVTGKSSANLARVSADGTQFTFYASPDSEPLNIVDGPDGDLFFTDQSSSRILHFVNAAPRASTGVATATAPVSASVQASVDPRGNGTQVVFDYGPTSTYGQTSAPTALPGTAAPIPVTGVLSGLAPGTTYHVRVRATNGEGAVAGADATFTTPPGIVDADADGVSPPRDCNDANAAIRPGAVDVPGDKVDQDCSGKDAAFPELTAFASFGFLFPKNLSSTTIRVLELSRLRGGETATIRCTGSKRCPFKTKTYKNLKKGKRTFGRSLFKARRLPGGTRISVAVTKAQSVGTSTVFLVRKGRRPKITRACLKPGATRTSACS